MDSSTRPPTTDSAMYQTMHRQPSELARLLREGWEPAMQAADLILGAERIFLVGIGTSYHAALVGEWLLRWVGLEARAVMSFDFAAYPEQHPLRPADAVVVMAHTGVKSFSSRALARAAAEGVTALSVGSLSAEHPGSRLVLRTVERERSAAYTASHTAAMFVLAQVATAVAQRRGLGCAAAFRSALESLPVLTDSVLAREDEVWPISRLAAERQVYVTGAGPNAVTALEAVIKAREAAAAHIDALPLEQFLHGPITTVNPEDLAVVVHVPDANETAAARTAEVAGVLARIGTPLWLVGRPAAEAPQATVFELPTLPEPISPILAVVPLQVLAYQVAVTRGRNPDLFRRDDPRYAAALSIKL
jgi:glucosamine--fructose-6-phosphate aminotransferase (isomerizing)